MKLKSQEQFYLEIIKGIGDFHNKGFEIDKFSRGCLREETFDNVGRLVLKPTGWIELKIIFKPKKEILKKR